MADAEVDRSFALLAGLFGVDEGRLLTAVMRRFVHAALKSGALPTDVIEELAIAAPRDPWRAELLPYLRTHRAVTGKELLQILKVAPNRDALVRVGRILRKLGYESGVYRDSVRGTTVRRWQREKEIGV